MVAGEQGIGKTRLVAELMSQVSLAPIWAACWEGDGAPAYWPWRRLLRELAADHRDELAEAIALLNGAEEDGNGRDARFTDVHCLELIGGSHVGGDTGPALDEQARRAYQQRIRELQVDLDEAAEHGDRGQAERAEEELDALVQQLTQAYGLSGRSRTTGSTAERARSAVSWRIRAAIRTIGEVQPELARHLRNAVRTGAWCSYRPETDPRWSVRSA